MVHIKARQESSLSTIQHENTKEKTFRLDTIM